MDTAETPSSGRGALRQPFIETANALASLYKRACDVERDARNGASRAAYMRVMQWAARKSRSQEPLTAAELISFCAESLADIPQVNPSSSHIPSSPDRSSTMELQSPPQQQQQQIVSKDEALVSDIKKLHVNPRKRQRVDISDAFIRACTNADNGSIVVSGDQAFIFPLQERPPSQIRTHSDPFVSQKNINPKKESKENKESSLFNAGSNELASNKKNKVKPTFHEKHKRK